MDAVVRAAPLAALPSLLLLLLLLLLLPPAAPAVRAQGTQGDPEAGRALAQQWCSGCHLVAREAGAALDVAPPFTAIAGYPERTADWLYRRVTVDPHPVMPNLNLTLPEARDINAYLDGLAREAAGRGGPEGG